MPKNHYSRIGIALVVSWIASICMQTAMGLICYEVFPEFYNSSYYYWIMYIICFYMLAVPLFAVISRAPMQNDRARKRITVKDFIRLIFVCISLTYIFNFIGVIVNSYISDIVGHTVVNPLNTLEGTNKVLMFICTCILSPIVEEIMFRGIIIRKLRPYGDKAAVWFSAVAFGLFHGNFSQFFYALVLGLVFASIAVKTNRLIYTILLHVAVNVSGSFVFPVLMDSTNLIIQNIGVILFFASAIYGLITAFRMVPHLRLKEKFLPGEIKRMILNPGSICFAVMSLAMFYSAISG